MSRGFVRRNLLLCALLLGETLLRFPLSATELSAINSCAQKCGKVQQLPCSCDMKCVVFKNCCEDFSSECAHIEAAGRDVYRKQLMAEVACVNKAFTITTCVQGSADTNATGETSGQTVFEDLADTSLKSDQNTGPEKGKPYTQARLLDVIEGAQVTDRVTGLVYLNMDVFRCFSANTSDAVIWTTRFAMHVIKNPISLNIFSQHVDNFISPEYIPPPEFMIGRCASKAEVFDLHESCDTERSNATFDMHLSRKCDQFFSYVQSINTNFYYKNIYCGICHESEAAGLNPVIQLPSVRHNHVFSVLASLANNEIQLFYGSSVDATLLWHEAVCNVSALSSLEEAECGVISCNSGYTKRPNGQCGETKHIYFAIPEDELALQEVQFTYFPALFFCHLRRIFETIDPADKPSESFLLRDKEVDRALYTFSFEVYAGDFRNILTDPSFIEVFRELLSIAKSYMYYRKSITSLPESSSKLLQINRHASHPVRVIPYQNYRYDPNIMRKDINPNNQHYTASVCLCLVNFYKNSPKDCIFHCMSEDVNTSETSALANLSTDTCFLHFIKMMKASDSPFDDLGNFQRENQGHPTVMSFFFAVYLVITVWC